MHDFIQRINDKLNFEERVFKNALLEPTEKMFEYIFRNIVYFLQTRHNHLFSEEPMQVYFESAFRVKNKFMGNEMIIKTENTWGENNKRSDLVIYTKDSPVCIFELKRVQPNAFIDPRVGVKVCMKKK